MTVPQTSLSSETWVVPSRIPIVRQLVALGRQIRRWFRRGELIVRLLGLPPVHPPSDEPGLILLQIDGLSRSRLEKALKNGRMPFLASLVRSDGYRVTTMYSGQPATTPAVLGELFYGVKRAVPAFSFRDHRTRRVVEMLEPEIAGTVQSELSQAGDGLLRGGAAYCDIYSGGAEDAEFCPGQSRWKRLDHAGMWKKAVIFLLHLPAVGRTLVAIVREAGLSTWRLLRRRHRIRNWLSELKFIPRHLVASVLLKEITATGIETDAVRGVSPVHGNFLGYDDVAHHCGPDAAIARRMLSEIDRSIQRIWQAAHRSPRRNYQVWIMADHGQEATVPYSEIAGRTINQAVCEAARGLLPIDCRSSDGGSEKEGAGTASRQEESPLTVAIGPVGFIYWPISLDDKTRSALVKRLLSTAQVPAVMARTCDAVRIWTDAGEFQLPEDAAQVFGNDHPHLSAIAEDFARICSHPDAGEIVIGGWRLGQPQFPSLMNSAPTVVQAPRKPVDS